MDQRGFSLIELIVVIGLISILLAIATLDFNSWQRTALVERQVKELYTEFQNARTTAAFTKVRQGIEFTSTQQITFRSFSSAADAVGRIVSVKNLRLPVTRSNWSQPAANRIDFETSGIMNDPLIKVICIPTTTNAAYDAIIISGALTNMGKVINKGAACGQNNVTQQ